MDTLQIDCQEGALPGQRQFTLKLKRQTGAFRSATLEFLFAVSARDQEYIRWYLEDYLNHDEDPAPEIAVRVEARMEEIGTSLFVAIFDASDEVRDLWIALRPNLAKVRIEVATPVAETNTIPWELLRDPLTGTRLALAVRAFVRCSHGSEPATHPRRPSTARGTKARILLAICRPRGVEDVPFRSVGGHIVRELAAGHDAFTLDVLRPPTFEQLAWTLERAHEQGAPYDAVHFDGHGVYSTADSLRLRGRLVDGLASTEALARKRGFVVFESLGHTGNESFVDGSALGRLLGQFGVPLIVLNACKSAYAEAPVPVGGMHGNAAGRNEVAAYGSFAQTALVSGAASVVAMRYVVYVNTAAQFVASLYAALARGDDVGDAVSAARHDLAALPHRRAGTKTRQLQDWMVPVVWEQAVANSRWALRMPPPGDPKTPPNDPAPTRPQQSNLPLPPSLGFVGQDSLFYDLERAFERSAVVLLHGYAGSGKTATAAEFARWYVATGGTQRPPLFESFRRRRTLAQVLDRFGRAFPDAAAPLSRSVLACLNRTPVLWIWDGVEQIAGFPAGAPSEWSDEEQAELRDFLDLVRASRSKILLTSRCDEAGWLADLVERVLVTPLSLQDRRTLAARVVHHYGERASVPANLNSLLRFTRGNPLTIQSAIKAAIWRPLNGKSGCVRGAAPLRRAGYRNTLDERAR